MVRSLFNTTLCLLFTYLPLNDLRQFTESVIHPTLGTEIMAILFSSNSRQRVKNNEGPPARKHWRTRWGSSSILLLTFSSIQGKRDVS